MSDPAPGVVITLREVYDSIQRLDAKMTQLTEARTFDLEQRSQMMARMDEIEDSLRQLQLRMAAWPAVATVAALLAIVIGVNNLLKG